MTIQFRKAERKAARLRLGICGPAGSGKTMSALLVAGGLGGRVALVDTESGSGELYAGSPGVPEYDVLPLEPPYEPKRYIEAIRAAEAGGYTTLILDSISHAWAGAGGLLDIHGKLEDHDPRKNGFALWRKVTPMHNEFVDALLSAKCHVIATMRTKTEWVVEEDERGKKTPRKVGLAPVQREGMDYEFTVVLDLSPEHSALASKDRTSLFDRTPFKPTVDTGRRLASWLAGASPTVAPVQTEPAPVVTPKEPSTLQPFGIRKAAVFEQYTKAYGAEAKKRWRDVIGKPTADSDADLEALEMALPKARTEEAA